jgi:hypothetical protein
LSKHAQRLLERSGAIPGKRQHEDLDAADPARSLAPFAILQRAAQAPQSLRPADILRLQQTLGNQVVLRLLRHSAPNRTGLPDKLRAGIETLSGVSLDDVRVHYNSARPAALDALSYAQGNDIHVGPGQEGHLPHEAWHVVQQVQGRVRPTLQLNGAAINDDQGLEHEASVMGAKAMQMRLPENPSVARIPPASLAVANFGVAQRIDIPPKPKNYDPDKPPDSRNATAYSQWQKYKNYDKFSKAVADHNKANNTKANGDDIWKKAPRETEAYAALKKVMPIKPPEPKPEIKIQPIEPRDEKPQVPDTVFIADSAYNHAGDGWAGIMMKKGPVAVTNADIRQYINDFILGFGFLSKASPDKTRARTWPDDKEHDNGLAGKSRCTIAYVWEKAAKRWFIFHFGPNGQFASEKAIFDTHQ